MSSDSSVVHKFTPNTGTFAGYTGLAVAGVLLVTVVLQMRDLQGLQLGLGILFASGCVWVAIIRPRAQVTRSTLVLRNMVTDTHIPLASVEHVQMKQTLNVWANGKRHMCLGIGKSRRKLTGRQPKSSIPFGGGVGDIGAGLSGQAHRANAAKDSAYEDFVIERIRDMSRDARRDGLPSGAVRRVVAVPEVVGLCVLAAAFVVSLFL